MNRRNGMGGLPTWHCQLSFGKICVLHIFTFTGNVSVPSALVTAIGLQTLGTMFILDTAEGKVETSCCFYLTFVYEFLVGRSKHRHERKVLIKTPFPFFDNFSYFKTLSNYMKLPESHQLSQPVTHTHCFYTLSWRNKNIFPTCSVTFIPISGVGWVIRVPQLPWLEILGPFWWRNQVSVRVLCWHALFVLTCPANVGMCASNEPTKKMHSVHCAYKQDTALQKKEWLGIAICCPINCFFMN